MKGKEKGIWEMVERWRKEWNEKSIFGKRKGNGRRVKTKRIKRKEIHDKRQKEQQWRRAQMD